MQYFNVTANDAGLFPAAPGPATTVSGILYDLDPKRARRAVFGGNSGAIDHTVQEGLKLRLGYALTRELRRTLSRRLDEGHEQQQPDVLTRCIRE